MCLEGWMFILRISEVTSLLKVTCLNLCFVTDPLPQHSIETVFLKLAMEFAKHSFNDLFFILLDLLSLSFGSCGAVLS